MPRNELLILHCPAGGGHKAAAQAIAERAEAGGIGAHVVDALSFAPPWFARLYVDAHLRTSAHWPGLYGSAYFATNHRWAVGNGELRRRVDHWLGEALLAEVSSRDPLAVVATHFFPLGILGAARRSGALRAPLVEVVTDYAAHAVWAEPGADAYCAPAGRACDDLVAHGVPPELVFATGIPVRSAFGQVVPWRTASEGTPLRVLVTSGGFGVGPVVRVIRSFAGMPNVALTVVCGQNPRLAARVERHAARMGLDATILGFERNMPERVAEADVVVTKPGGLTVSECLAAGRPLVLVGAVPGQESLNRAWLTDQGAGVSCRPDEVGPTVAALGYSKLSLMAARARALSAPFAADRVMGVALAAAGQPRGSHPGVRGWAVGLPA